MRGVYPRVRQAMLAALLLWPAAVPAEVHAIIDGSTGSIHISGLEASQRLEFVEDPKDVFLQIESLDGHRTMALSVVAVDETLVLEPKFSLQSGETYVLRLGLEEHEIFETVLRLPSDDVTRPELLWLSPGNAVIPENTLRLYLMFSEPMAIGQVREAVWLERPDGRVVDSPFLNLQAELWDGEQRRLTLLFDPGRIKRGVGPNETSGAPLEDGGQYFLVLSPDFASAAGETMGSETRLALTVGPAQREVLDPSIWALNAPEIGSTDALEMRFDRLMDRGASERLIAVIGPSGETVPGVTVADATVWHFTPSAPWTGLERLEIQPDLEDVAGNTIRAPFDAAPGTIGQVAESMTLVLFETHPAD